MLRSNVTRYPLLISVVGVWKIVALIKLVSIIWVCIANAIIIDATIPIDRVWIVGSLMLVHLANALSQRDTCVIIIVVVSILNGIAVVAVIWLALSKSLICTVLSCWSVSLILTKILEIIEVILFHQTSY